MHNLYGDRSTKATESSFSPAMIQQGRVDAGLARATAIIVLL